MDILLGSNFWAIACFIPLQDEEQLLLLVEEAQNKLLEVNNRLLSKKNQVAAAKAELNQKTQSLQEIKR